MRAEVMEKVTSLGVEEVRKTNGGKESNHR